MDRQKSAYRRPDSLRAVDSSLMRVTPRPTDFRKTISIVDDQEYLIHESLLATSASFTLGTMDTAPPTATVIALVKNLS